MNTETKIEMIDIQLLSPHPRNKEIYGEENIKELADKIKESNWISPLVITEKNGKNITISGHRRTYACMYLGITEVPITRVKFENENDELERLLLENEYREKTITQKTQEGILWEEIEREKASKRQAMSGSKNLGLVRDTCPTPVDQGRTRDAIAQKVGIGSGRTYERAKIAVNKIDELKKDGKTKDVEFLTTILNENVRGARDIAEAKIDEIPIELKDKVIKKEISVQKAVSDIRKDLSIITDYTKKPKKQDVDLKSQETKICNQCKKEKVTSDFYEGKYICKDCYNENRDKNRNPKNVYGNEIKIDKEKIKGMNIEAIIANAKDTNKSIDMVDYESTSMEFTCNIDMFIRNVSKYTEELDTYKLSEIDKNNKNKFLKSIADMEYIMNKLKNILI